MRKKIIFTGSKFIFKIIFAHIYDGFKMISANDFSSCNILNRMIIMENLLMSFVKNYIALENIALQRHIILQVI